MSRSSATLKTVDLVTPAIESLEEITKNGLPECYRENIEDYWGDFYPGMLHWTPDELVADLTALRNSPRVEAIRESFQEKFGVDLFDEFEESLKVVQSDEI